MEIDGDKEIPSRSYTLGLIADIPFPSSLNSYYSDNLSRNTGGTKITEYSHFTVTALGELTLEEYRDIII